MFDFFGYEIDFLSLLPALFALILSIINYYKMSRPANIIPTKLVSYGLISSSYQEGYKLVLPLVFYNKGSNKGTIIEVKVGFIHEQGTEYLDLTGRARLSEIVDEDSTKYDWEGFSKNGYRILQPTYPITIKGNESKDMVFIATTYYEDNVLTLDKSVKCTIEVIFDNNKNSKIEFPFFLSEELIPDDKLSWFKPESQI